MNIGRFSVTRPVAVTMRIAALVLLGTICLMRIPIDLLPRVDIPIVAVSVQWPNTAPEEMETQITRPLEQAVSTVPGMDAVTSDSELGSSFVRIQFDYGVDVNQAAVDVMQAVQRAKRRFPRDNTISEPTVFKFDPSGLPILNFGVSGMEDQIALRNLLLNEISPIIESAGGVAQVNISGGQERAIIVDVDPKKLQAYNLSISEISARIRQENLSAPAGIAQEGQTEYTIRSVGYFQSVEEIRSFPLKTANGQIVKLGDVADVRDENQEIRSYVRMNGEPAITLSVTKQSDSNTVEVADNVKAAVAAIDARYPEIEFRLAYDQSKFISKSILDLKETALIGGALAILLITFFLRNFRSTFVVALSIPISILSTFSLFYFCGFTLNTISLSGLALATGLIVDDAIVVLENIYRHIERDKKRSAEAAVSGTQEILSAVFASTFTVMIVFLPLLLIKGQAGQTFTQFALVVVFSLAISLLDAVTVVPMLASRLVREKDVIEEAHPELRTGKTTLITRLFDRFGAWFHSLDTSYKSGLNWAIHKRPVVVGIAVMACLLAVVMWPMVGTEQLPSTDTGDITVRARLPIGTALETTRTAMLQIEQIIMNDPDVDTVLIGAGTSVGLRGGGGGSPHEGSASIKLKDQRSSRTEDVIKRLQGQLAVVPGVRAQVSPFDVVANVLGGNQTGVSIDVFGQELPQIQAAAEIIKNSVSGIPGLENVDTDAQEATPEIQWKIDREKAQLLGVSFQDVATTLSASTSGALSSYYQERGFQYPIYVQVPEANRKSVEELKKLPIIGTGSSNGDQVLLGQVATPVIGSGPNEIQRQNRQRYLTVSGRIADRPESEVQADIQTALAGVSLPEGSYWQFGLRQQRRAEEFSGLGLAVFLAIALIYMLLASQFESFIYPLVVLTSVPLCAIGMVLALFISGRAFGLTAFIGLLMLIGIVVKNGILLVDYTNQLRSRGIPRDEAILTACSTRLRPILMTTCAAILGMLPLAIGLGAGSELYAPLATAVIGGLATSSVLTLFVVPVVYTFFDDLGRKFRREPRDLDRASIVEPSIEAVEQVPVVVD